MTLSLALNLWQNNKIETLQSDIHTISTLVSIKQSTIDEQSKEIREMPAKYIETTRAMDKEICMGLNQIDKVMSMSSGRNVESSNEAGKEVTNEKAITVDIDDRLPSNLIKLLNDN